MAALVLGGCSVGDSFKRPEVKAPAAWQGAQGPVTGWPSAEWWQAFRSPRLDGLMAQAQTANTDLAAAVARVRQADAQARIAGASLLPAVSAGGGFDRQRLTTPKTTSSRTTPAKVPYTSTESLNLNVSYEVDFWGKNEASVEAAKALAQSSRFDQQTVGLTVQSSVATTYFDILGQQERLRVAREGVANAEGVLSAIRDRAAAGLATSLDLAQQESVVANQRATIAPLEQAIRQNLNALAILVGQLPEDLRVEPEPMAAVALPEVTPGLPSELLARRPDVQATEAQLAAANANVTVARAAWFPSVQLTAQGGVTSLALATLLDHTSLLYSLASSISQPIFQGGKLDGQIELERARYDELVQTYRKAVLSAFTDVENALVAVQKTAEEEEAQRIAEATARRAYEIAQAQLRGGIIDITTVLNTQRVWFTAQDALAQARLAHLQAIVGLYKAMGGGWPANA
jgi:NodT family efflux transporter outer membrane factor (OMF) lipoprotein